MSSRNLLSQGLQHSVGLVEPLHAIPLRTLQLPQVVLEGRVPWVRDHLVNLVVQVGGDGLEVEELRSQVRLESRHLLDGELPDVLALVHR